MDVVYRLWLWSRKICKNADHEMVNNLTYFFRVHVSIFYSVHGEIGCSKWKKTLAYLLVLPGSRARIVRCGGRYDPQLVKRSSE